MYADELTDSMEKAITETNRRRKIQEQYNQDHGIIPQTIRKSVRDTIKATIVEDIQSEYEIGKEETVEQIISKLTDEMLECASKMEFEKAAELRDKIVFMAPEAFFNICKKDSYSPCKSLKKCSVPFGRFKIDARLIISVITLKDKRALATLIYYPEEKLEIVLKEEENLDDWYKITLHRPTE